MQAIVTTADPGDYGDLITVAMDVKITESEASTDAAAAVRDAGAKVVSTTMSTQSVLLGHDGVFACCYGESLA